MGRRARIILPGVPHHVTQRGNRRQRVFFHADNYHAYLELLYASALAFDFTVWSYCLMPNHIHLLLVPTSESSLRDGISHLHQMYTRSVNRSHGWTGHLWQGRFFSCPVEISKAAYVARYIELNPVRAKLCENPRHYPWSSAEVACAQSKEGKSGFSPLYAPGGTWEEYLRYDPLLESPKELKLIRTSVSTGRPLGDEQFISRVEAETGVSFALRKPGPKPATQDMMVIN